MAELLTSADVAKLAGVGTTAVKRWADSGVLPCIRTAGGHRRFRREDIDRFVRRAALTDGPGDEWGEWIEALVSEADTYAILGRLFAERSRRGSWSAVAEAMGALLVEIGRRWEGGRLSVIEEHLASAGLQRAIAAAAETIAVPADAPRCLLASAEGDEHTVGLSLVELCLREAGWRAEWAGAHTRPGDIADRLRHGGIEMVALSAAASMSDLPSLTALAAQVGETCRAAGVVLAFGGSGAWPEPPAYGTRFRALEPFTLFARDARDHLPGA